MAQVWVWIENRRKPKNLIGYLSLYIDLYVMSIYFIAAVVYVDDRKEKSSDKSSQVIPKKMFWVYVYYLFALARGWLDLSFKDESSYPRKICFTIHLVVVDCRHAPSPNFSVSNYPGSVIPRFGACLVDCTWMMTRLTWTFFLFCRLHIRQ